MPLHVGCDDIPCTLSAGTWVLDGEFSFILGMEFTVPDGWESREQDAGEFNLFPLAHPDDHFFMAKDIAAVKSDGSLALAPNVPRTADGIEAYWRSDPNLVVSPSEPATIGDGIPATTFVVTVSPDAAFIDPECPVYPQCADFFTDPRFWDGGVYGIGAPAAVRIYFATIPNGSSRHHLLLVVLEGADEAALEALTEETAPIIQSLRFPESFPTW